MRVRYDPDLHHRRSIRLKGYDYTSARAYFVTVCTQERACLFGDVADGQVRLNSAGKMVETIWFELPGHYPGVDVDAFTVMPNHVHGIIVLVGAGPRACPDQADAATHEGQPRGVAPTNDLEPGPRTLSLADVVHRFKTLTTKRYADGVHRSELPPFAGRLWQRNYYEHIIRDDADLDRIRQYITDNPARWAEDTENPLGAPLVGAQSHLRGAPVGAAPRGRPEIKAPRAGRWPS